MRCAGATVEATCKLLKDLGSILSLFDEASGFMQSFGLYKSGGSAYDRGIYLELFGARNKFRRDLKSEKTVVTDPRLNISLCGHPNSFLLAIKDEFHQKADGLMQRFLSSCPRPNFLSAQEQRDARNKKKSYTVTVLLYIVYLLHKSPKDYSFSEEALSYYEDVYTNFREICELMVYCDSNIW